MVKYVDFLKQLRSDIEEVGRVSHKQSYHWIADLIECADDPMAVVDGSCFRHGDYMVFSDKSVLVSEFIDDALQQIDTVEGERRLLHTIEYIVKERERVRHGESI